MESSASEQESINQSVKRGRGRPPLHKTPEEKRAHYNEYMRIRREKEKGADWYIQKINKYAEQLKQHQLKVNKSL